MAEIVILAVGRIKAGPEQSLVAEYLKRLPWPVTVTEVEERRPIVGPERQAREAELILAAIPEKAIVVALDERGKTLSSQLFAEKVVTWRDDGRSIVFVIGGADGLLQSVRDRADYLLAFGPMTWPHALVRSLLAEQIYRAWTISTGHPYHK